MLEEQDILQFCPRALFRNSDEVADVSEMPAEEALAYARGKSQKAGLKTDEPFCHMVAESLPALVQSMENVISDE